MDKNHNNKAKYRVFSHVSRETINDLIFYEKYLLENNNKFNLISKSTEKDIWNRHFRDSMQLIDFIDKNCKCLIDLGSGAGFPGLILAIAAKDRRIPIKIKLIEKSPKKAKFLDEIIKQLNLNVKVLNQNVLEQQNKFISDVFVARAFKPLKTQW